MQTLDIDRPDMPDLQFVLLVTALCTSRLTSLNVPDRVRTTLFDRCWVLVHDGPPPRRREDRVINLRPWTEVTLDAMVETIRTVLTEAGIRTLSWDHSPSEPTWTSTPEALPVIQQFDYLYSLPSEGLNTCDGEPVHLDGVTPSFERGGIALEREAPQIRQLLGEMAALMTAFSPALKRHAEKLDASGNDSELVGKLLKGADVMRATGHMYLAWARHYAALSEGKPEAAKDANEAEFNL
jgi:hypothetical protein